MSSSKRNGSVSRAVKAAAKNKLHMDRNPQHSRITDPSNPAGRRKEIDNVMKRARQASPGSWDRKLLEVEEKDPNRWRHTGYKQLYLDGSRSRSSSQHSRRSRSPLPMRRSRSPVAMGRRSRSPVGRRSGSPVGRRSRSPVGRRSRSPIRRKSPPPARRSPRRSPMRRGSPTRSPKRRSPRPRSPPARRDSPRARPRVRPPSPKRPRPPSPTDPRRSSSGSSSGSCSDESCSVCSAKIKKAAAAAAASAKPGPKRRSRSASPRAVRRPPPPPAAPARALQPTKELLKARDTTKRSREEKVLEWQRTQMTVNRPAAPIAAANIKREGERRPPEPPPGATVPRRREKKRGVSPGVVAAALAESGSESESDASSEHPRRLTLSERFGRMAQWSADRSARLENMKITRRESSLHVHIERNERAKSLEPVDEDSLDPEPVGSYPEELLAAAPGGLPSWDDVRVRYDYYKKRGYLRGLTLSDYVKWEEWWYKYQEWLKRERAYERWADGDVPVRRERRKRGGRHRRS